MRLSRQEILQDCGSLANDREVSDSYAKLSLIPKRFLYIEGSVSRRNGSGKTVLGVSTHFTKKEHLMFRRAIDLLPIGWAIVLLMSGCTNSPNGPNPTSPTMPSFTFKAPNTKSSDPNVQSVTAAVASMNSYAQQFSLLKSLSGVQKGNTETWTYRMNTVTVTLTGTIQPDGSSQWAMVLNGTDTSGATYSNFTVARGTSSGDGKSGTWDLYDSTSTSPQSELSWTMTNSILNGTLKSFTGSSVSAQTVVVNNPDNSGQLTLYTGTTLTFKAVWQPDGSGNWWTYDPNGAQTGTGNWT